MKKRLDLLMVERALAPSREKAKAYITVSYTHLDVYKRQIRSFMGLLMIYMLCVPVFGLLGKGEELTEKFFYTFQQEMQEMKKLESEELQYFFLNEGYEQEAAGEIADFLQKSGINPVNTAVHIEGKQLFVELTFAQEISREQEGGIRDGLRESFGIAEENCQIYDGKNVDVYKRQDRNGNNRSSWP